jgi:ABC-type lipoprotein export system ATPase subunit
MSKDNSTKRDVLLKTSGLCKSYRLGKHTLNVLKGIDMQVGTGEFVAIYGHSGSGKSTLLHILGLLDRPSEGQVIVDSRDAANLSSGMRNSMRCRDIGFIFQFYQLLPELNVLENTCLPAMVGTSVLGWPARRGQIRRHARDLLEELGLGERIRHKPKELSGGERQRVAIARALVNNPKLLLADEPTGNLDSNTGKKIIDILLRYNREHNQTTVLVTHDSDIAGLVNRTLTLKDGRLV